MHFLYPVDPINPRLVDEEFRAEAVAARELGHTALRVNTDALERETGEPVLPWPALDEPAVTLYRGWMLRPGTYAALEERLAAKGVSLLTSAQQYQRSHELPGWVDAMGAYTAKTAELTATALSCVEESLSVLGHGKLFLRDYSKSLKHNPEACTVPAGATPEEALAVVSLFEELRGESLAGSVLLREFETYVSPELRTWWVGGELRLSSAHPDTPDELPSFARSDWLPAGFTEALASLDLPFVTCDFAEREDGAVRLVELGDGQVSGRPRSLAPEEFYSSLW